MTEIWTEKYRPRKLDDIIGNEPIVKALKELVRRAKSGDWNIPHMIFAGGPGLGKTTAAQAMARDLYGTDSLGRPNNFDEYNASDDRGIGVVRGPIKDRLAQASIGFPKRILFLDEMDKLTPEAQAALRRPMEHYAKTNIIILGCNDTTTLHPALLSRCIFQNTKFRPVGAEPLRLLLAQICEKEGLFCDPFDTMNLIIERSNGSVRDAINTLFECSLQGKEITKEAVATFLTKPVNQSAMKLFQLIKGGDLRKAVRKVEALHYGEGLAGREVLKGLHDIILKEPCEPKLKSQMILTLGKGLEFCYLYDDLWGAKIATERLVMVYGE